MSKGSRVSSTPRVSRVKVYEEPTNIPFPEWQDSDIASEKWDVVKDVKKAAMRRKSITSKRSSESVPNDVNFYMDIHGSIMPPSIEVDSWKRLSELYDNVEFVLNQQTIDFAALTQGCKHILHSEFIRAFLSTIGILEYMTTIRPWHIESVTNTFTPNTENIAWKPWHHIYSHCSAGKAAHHNPQYNPSGKYIVRLHWLGYWRKIYVDDRMPIDMDQNILLPGYRIPIEEIEELNDSGSDKKSLSPKKSRKSKASKLSVTASEKKRKPEKLGHKHTKVQVEIWPYILAKALLKIACLTWTREKEVVDFSPIACLTGWICLKMDTTEMDPDDIWKICVAYSPKFVWDDQDDDVDDDVVESEKSAKTESDTESRDSSKTKKHKKPKKEPDTSIDETKVYCLVGSCTNIANFMKDLEIESIPNEWNQDFLIEQSRDIPLKKPQQRPELPRWKRFRWIYWAIANGLWPDDEFAPPIRSLKFFNNFKKYDPLLLDRVLSSDASPSKIDKKGTASKHQIDTKENKKSAKGQRKGKGGELKIFPLVDKSIWVDFTEVKAHINTLSIYFRPSQFTSNMKLANFIKHANRSEMSVTNKDKDKKAGTTKVCQELRWTLNIKESRNEPLYLLMDSLDEKFLVITLCQIGYVDRVMIPPIKIRATPYANIVLENYSWHQNKIGAVQIFVTTIGSKSVLFYLKPGRVICKLWVWCNSDYFINILSNTQITIGNFDNIFELMNNESLILGKLAQEVGRAFGNLVQAFGDPSYLDVMRKFNRIYKCNMLLDKIKSKEIYREFMNLILNQIDSEEHAFALKVLFLDPNICNQTLHKEWDYPSIMWKTSEEIFLDEENILEKKAQERAAVKIQSFFKTIYIKKILERHIQGHRKHNEIYDSLKQVYYDVFADEKRSTFMRMLKDFYFNNSILKSTYLYNDLLNVIDIKSYKGSTTTNYNTWVFITRQKFINRSSEPLIMKTVLFSNLSKYVVRIFNNDTGEEIKRVTNHAETCFYPLNRKGYTILCYGWTTEPMKVSWKLCLIFIKRNTPSFLTAEENLNVKTLNFCYNPNIDSIICKCKMELRQTAEVTVRISTSSLITELELAIRDCCNKIHARIQGKHNVILPLTRLKWTGSEGEADFPIYENRKNTKYKPPAKQRLLQSKDKMGASASILPSIYYVEAKVLNNTWPLTKKEWIQVKMDRQKHLLYPPATKLESPRVSKKKVTSLETMEQPYWSLQVIHNVGDNLTVARDLTRRNEINEIKKSWYEEDPDRYEKSKEIRENYLKVLCGYPCDNSNSETQLKPSAESDTTLIKWIPETLMLSAFDLTRYYSKDESERRYADINKYEIHLRNESSNEMNTLCYTLSQCRDRMDKLSFDQIENFVIIRQWYDDCRRDSEDLMTRSYALRDEFINMIIEANKKPLDITEEKTKLEDKEKKAKKK